LCVGTVDRRGATQSAVRAQVLLAVPLHVTSRGTGTSRSSRPQSPATQAHDDRSATFGLRTALFRSQTHSLLRLGIETCFRPPQPRASQGHPGRFSFIGRIAEVRWKQRKRSRKGRFVLPEQASGCVRSSDGAKRRKRSERRYRRQDWRQHATARRSRE